MTLLVCLKGYGISLREISVFFFFFFFIFVGGGGGGDGGEGNKKNISKYHLLKFLSKMLSVKHEKYQSPLSEHHENMPI